MRLNGNSKLKRVDFGGVGKYKNGTITVNIDPKANPNIVCDIRESTRELDKHFKRESLDQIACFHTLEHLPSYEILPSLKYWRDFLKPTGRLLVVVPDTELLIEDYNMRSISFQAMMTVIFNRTPVTRRPAFQQHYWAWTEQTLKMDLFSCGYKHISTFGNEIYPESWTFAPPGMELFPEFGNYSFPNLRLAAHKEKPHEIHNKSQ